jgi:hypothetical protein
LALRVFDGDSGDRATASSIDDLLGFVFIDGAEDDGFALIIEAEALGGDTDAGRGSDADSWVDSDGPTS